MLVMSARWNRKMLHCNVRLFLVSMPTFSAHLCLPASVHCCGWSLLWLVLLKRHHQLLEVVQLHPFFYLFYPHPITTQQSTVTNSLRLEICLYKLSHMHSTHYIFSTLLMGFEFRINRRYMDDM